MDQSTRYLTCKNCSWVHFGVSREFALKETAKFNTWFDKQSKETRKSYGNHKVNVTKEYGQCNRCGGPSTNTRTATNADLERIRGCTLGPLIFPEEQVI